jgi:LPS-assembly lipoprotein
MRALLSIVLVLSFSACGFHLRGQATLPYSTLYVSGPSGTSLTRSLTRVLKSSGVKVVERQEDGEVGLIILSDTREKSILSLSGAGRAQEYELRERVSFRIVTAKEPDLPASEIVTQRTISFNDAQVLAKESEEALLYRDMENDTVQQLLRRLQAAKK